MPKPPPKPPPIRRITTFSIPSRKLCDQCHQRLNRYYLVEGYHIYYYCSKNCAERAKRR